MYEELLIQFEAQCKAEREAYRRVRLLAEQITRYLPLIWHHGDGYGGAVTSEIEEIFNRAGFRREPLSNGKNKRRKSIGRRSILKAVAASCVKCGNRESLVIDHIVPLARGGSDEPTNLQVLCANCNSKKGTNDN